MGPCVGRRACGRRLQFRTGIGSQLTQGIGSQSKRDSVQNAHGNPVHHSALSQGIGSKFTVDDLTHKA